MQGSIPRETTSLIGRQQELAGLDAALARHRLITLTGPGGVGKTRLAQRAAASAVGRPLLGGTSGGGTRAAAPRFPDGAWWADLSTLDSPRLLLATVSDAVDFADHSPRMPVEALCEWLADKRLLLVLDSCEHLADACTHLVGELLTAAPGLTVLATSRRPLLCRGEELREVQPLPAGGPEAVELFGERVAARLGRTPLAEPGATDAAASICRRLEGIPLAIELAAAQVGVGPDGVADVDRRLGARFEVLAREDYVWPPRHQTLRTAIGWSHELCAPLERLLWARLSVFRGDFGLDAARAVAAGGPLGAAQVPAMLERLAEQSVVRRAASGEGAEEGAEDGAEESGRYRMLDTIREYGQGWLAELGEAEATAQRHADHFTGLARLADAGWSGTGQLSGYRTIEQAHPDLRAALDHLFVHDPPAAAELAGLLVYYWTCCGHLKEARACLEHALEVHTAPDAARTRALIGLGATVTLQGDYERAAEIDAEVRAALADIGDRDQYIAAACLTGLLNMLVGRPQRAIDAVREALGPAPGPAFDSPDRLRCHLIEVLSLTALGFFDEGRERALELREHCVRTGEVWTRSYLDYQLSIVALFSGAPGDAIGYARTMLESKRLLGDAFGIALGLDLLAAALAAEGRAEEAASVFGAGGAYWRSVGHPQRGAPELKAVREHCEESARAALGEEAYAAAFARGAANHGPAGLAAILEPCGSGPE